MIDDSPEIDFMALPIQDLLYQAGDENIGDDELSDEDG